MKLQGRDLRLELQGEDVRLLHAELAQLGFLVPDKELAAGLFGSGTHDAVRRFQKGHDLESDGVVDVKTAEVINRDVESASYAVDGLLSSPDRVGLGGIRIEIVDKNVGKDVLVAEAVTEETGRYAARFEVQALLERGKAQPDLQARAHSGKTFLGASDVCYNAGPRTTLDIRLPPVAMAVPSEYEALTDALAAYYQGPLGELEESDGRQDLTYLANKTGWDARAVAMAALADQLSRAAASTVGRSVHSALYYSLFRGGLPTNPELLYQADPSTVTAIWKQGIAQGTIPQGTEAEIPAAVKAFRELAAVHALTASTVPGTSSLKELLEVSLGNDMGRQEQFAHLCAQHQGDPTALWKAVEESFGEKTVKRLQLDGQLAYLTLNNAPLLRRIHEAEALEPLTAPGDLVPRGYFRAEKWAEVLDETVPTQVPGATIAERRSHYAELLAAQVRLSFPTAVVAELVRAGDMPVAGSDDVRRGVQMFLAEHAGEFELGVQPVEQYIVRNKLEDQVTEPVKEQLKRIQRVYQITETDQAMAGLLRNDLHSAYQVSRFDEEDFVLGFQDSLGGEEQARQTHRRAQQVHGAVLNIVGHYLTSRTAPALGRNPEARILVPAPNGQSSQANNAADVVATPTLEGLFGQMDYCACEHCRSVLSPAAYLVDLLDYLEPADSGGPDPQQVLLRRRPDIAQLPLTCENTNSLLPYIDLVNETLEYFVTHGLSIAGYPGHDTGPASPPDLLASPQHVEPAAYVTLKREVFPSPLPFHHDLEVLRRYFERFDVPLEEAMEVLRPAEALDRADEGGYGWRDILMERLKLSRREHALLTQPSPSLRELYGFPPETTEPQALAELGNAKAFARRLRLTYADVIELLKTRFVNPEGTLIARLERLAVPFATLRAFKEGRLAEADFNRLLPPDLDQRQYGGDVKRWLRDDRTYARIMSLIILASPGETTSLCSFADLEFRYAGPRPDGQTQLRSIDYVRMLRFVRLWRKLGWTIEQTDKAITALYPTEEIPAQDQDEAADLEHLGLGFATLLLRLGELTAVMRRLGLQADRDLLGALALWAPIDVHGPRSLYRQMFLAPPGPSSDPAFADDGYGGFLQDARQKLLGHAEAVRAGLGLTADEFLRICQQLGFGPEAPLSLQNVSSVYRHGWLARKLNLSVRALLALLRVSGLDPFTPPEPPAPAVLCLIDLVRSLEEASLMPEQALYLVWNENLSGASVPPERDVVSFARSLRTGLAAVDSEFALGEDPVGEGARARMALVYGPDPTGFFFGLLDDTVSRDVAYSHPRSTLEREIIDASEGRVGYDDLRKRLSYKGVLTSQRATQLQNVTGVPPAFVEAVDRLRMAYDAMVTPFFRSHPELGELYGRYLHSAEPAERKRAALLEEVLSTLKPRRKRQQALAALASAAAADPALVRSVMDDPQVLHAAGEPAAPAVADLVAIETGGLSAEFFWTETATGTPDQARPVEPIIAYAPTAPRHLPPNPTAGARISGVWTGYVEAPSTGSYGFEIEANSDASVALDLDGQSVPLTHRGTLWSNAAEVSFTAGVPRRIRLSAEQLTDTLVLRWTSTGLARQPVPSGALYPAVPLGYLRSTYIRFLKVASLATTLGLTAPELAHLATRSDYHVGEKGWLNAVPVAGRLADETARALRDRLGALLEFRRLRGALSPRDDGLLRALQAPNASLPDDSSALLALTRWDRRSVETLLGRLGKSSDFSELANLETFVRVFDAYDVATRLGITPSALLPATTNEPAASTASEFGAALRARYTTDDWYAVLRPINDEMRTLRRDALVAHILHRFAEPPAAGRPDRRHIDTPDKLFEYFLLDVEMDSCMQTSRVRNALSAVQLFVERSLMNLEPDVPPAAIRAGEWQWRKRYRVWEANRKVWLWPEDWLEPELRDQQSPIFRETMSTLLEGDITNDAATTALGSYLTKLDEVAKLEPCTVCLGPVEGAFREPTVHVVARTAGAHRKYFYRRRELGSWTPWEPIRLEIEDNPVTLVVWNDRLLLFWLKILRKGQAPGPVAPASGGASADGRGVGAVTLTDLTRSAAAIARGTSRTTVQALLCWSEYANGAWQPQKTSDPHRPTEVAGGMFAFEGTGAFDRSRLTLVAMPEGDGLRVRFEGCGWSSFVLYNTHSLPLRREEAPSDPWPRASREVWPSEQGRSTLLVTYHRDLTSGYWLGNDGRSLFFAQELFRVPLPFAAVDAGQALVGAAFGTEGRSRSWNAPFLFADTRAVFYVTSTEQPAGRRQAAWYGVAAPLSSYVAQVPPLVVRKAARRIPPPTELLVVDQRAFGIVDPAPIEQLLTVDTGMRAAIGMTGTVRYGEKELGPTGALEKKPL